MNIHGFQIHSPNFGAEFVCTSHALAKNSSDEYEPIDTSIVKLDVRNDDDMTVLKNLTEDWNTEYNQYKYGKHYSSRILGIAEQEQEHLKSHNYSMTSIYMMTTQDSDFDKLDHKKVLGEAVVFDSEHMRQAKVNYIQVRPKYKYNATSDRDIKEVGKNFLEDLKNKVTHKPASIFADENSCWFYRALNAEEDYEEVFSFVV